jgi:hypothetical protein
LEKKKKLTTDHEKALFDFDEEIDDLDIIEDRYPVVKSEKNNGDNF